MARFSFSGPARNCRRTATALMAVLAVFACTASALAAGSKVLPPERNPQGLFALGHGGGHGSLQHRQFRASPQGSLRGPY